MAYKKIDGIIDTKLKVMKTTGLSGEVWADNGNYFQNDETGGLSVRTGAVGNLQNIQVADPTATTDSATKDYVDTNAGSVATTEQVVTIEFDFTDFNAQVPFSTTGFQYAVMQATFTLPDGAYVTGCGVWIDPTSPWSNTAECIVGDATTPVPAGPPPAQAGNVMPDRWMLKTNNNASAGGKVFWQPNWDLLNDNVAKTIFVCIGETQVADPGITVGKCQVFLKYVEAPRT